MDARTRDFLKQLKGKSNYYLKIAVALDDISKRMEKFYMETYRVEDAAHDMFYASALTDPIDLFGQKITQLVDDPDMSSRAIRSLTRNLKKANDLYRKMLKNIGKYRIEQLEKKLNQKISSTSTYTYRVLKACKLNGVYFEKETEFAFEDYGVGKGKIKYPSGEREIDTSEIDKLEKEGKIEIIGRD